MTPLEAIEAHLTAELERRKRFDRGCPSCIRRGRLPAGIGADGIEQECPGCGGTGWSPSITAAEEALKLCREERTRVERLLAWLSVGLRSGQGVGLFAAAALAEYNAPVKEDPDHD